MENKRNLITILTFLLIVSVVIILAFLTFKNITYNNSSKLPEDDKIQVYVLKSIYLDFIGNTSNNSSIILDESATKNLVTGKQFNDENKSILKSLETTVENSNSTYTLYANYNSRTKKITLELLEKNNDETESCNENTMGKYSIFTTNKGTLSYKADGYKTTSFSLPPAQN